MGIFHLKSLRFVQRLLLGSTADRELAQLFFAALTRATPQVLAARARAVCRVDCREALRRCPVPILSMIATGDRIIPSRHSALFQSIRPDVQMQRFASAHLILQCATDDAVVSVCRFMDAVHCHDVAEGEGIRL